MKKTITVASVPEPLNDNPYQDLLYRGLEDEGVRFCPERILFRKDLFRLRRDVDILHFHWLFDETKTLCGLIRFILKVSCARALGYRSAYVVGYAYGKGYREAEDFVPHGWTEVCHGNTCFPADPTWAEAGFIDASHIEFAKISDNYFPETFVSGKGRKGSKIELKPTDTSFKILEMKEEPVIKSESTLLDNELFRGYAVLRTRMETPGCALTKIESASCQLEEKDFLETQNPEELVYFCGERDFFSIFKIPLIDGGKRYNCPVSVLPSFGKQTNETVNIVSIPEPQRVLEDITVVSNVDKLSKERKLGLIPR